MAIKVDGTEVTGLPAGWPSDQALDPLDAKTPQYVIKDSDFTVSGPKDWTTSSPPGYSITGNADGVDGAGGSAGSVLRDLADQSKILLYVVENGTGNGTNSTISAAAVANGSGSGLKVDLTIAGKVAVKAVLNTAGTGYKDGDIVTVAKATATTDDDVTLRITNAFTPNGVGIQNSGGTKASLTDKTDLATTVGNTSTGSGMKVNLFVDSGSGGGNPEFVRAEIKTAGTGYRPGDVVTVAKANSGTDNNVVLVVQ